MIEGLKAILEKEVVISTVSADDVFSRPEDVEAYYLHHVKTFIPFGEIPKLPEKLLRLVECNQTPKGYIVAEYGYGKTSTLLFLWNQLEEKDMLGVPPFQCSSLLDILKATYGWAKFRLAQRYPNLTEELEEIYRKYSLATVEEMAKKYAKERGISHSAAREMLEDLMSQGKLILDVTPVNLISFFEEVIQIIKKADFKGMVILPDEFQQYIVKSNLSERIQELREFVWGLSSREMSLGVIIGMPSHTESVITDRGEDILHRLKEDGLHYRLDDIYTRKFPKILWERYVDFFNLGELANEIIDEYALESIGQIAERKDLGEGPRTVIEALKCAINYHQKTGKTYTPIAFIEDILQGNVVFQTYTLKNAINRALDSPLVDTKEKERSILLIAAFPYGCGPKIWKKYGLYDTVIELSKSMHGGLLTYLTEGYALSELQREGPRNTIDKIIYEFWRKYEEDFAIYDACDTFFKKLLPLIFEPRRGNSPIGWTGIDKFQPDPDLGGYVVDIEGTFNQRYPSRRLRIRIIRGAEVEKYGLGDVDLDDLDDLDLDFQFDFIMELEDRNKPGFIKVVNDRYLCFHLNLNYKPEIIMPDDLRKLQDYVNPELVTPLLMLSLVEYFEKWDKKHTIPDGDKPEVDFLTTRLLNHAIQWLFNEEFSMSAGYEAVGKILIQDIFNSLCERNYPNYRTFKVTAHYEKSLMDYFNALQNLNLKRRRGHVWIEGPKEELSRLFGCPKVSTFENKIKNDYKDLIEVKEWKGKRCSLRLKLHPLEEKILEELRNSSTYYNNAPSLKIDKIYKVARKLGYLDDEFEWAVRLLDARMYIGFDRYDDPQIIYLETRGPAEHEIRKLIKDIEERLLKLSQIFDESEILKFKGELTKLNQKLSLSMDDKEELKEELDEMFRRLKSLEAQIKEITTKKQEGFRQVLSNIILNLDRDLITLKQTGELDREILGQVGFVQHLNEIRQKLIQKREGLKRRIGKIREKTDNSIKKVVDGSVDGVLELHKAVEECTKETEKIDKELDELKTEIEALEKWTSLLQRTDRLFSELKYEHTEDLKEELKEVINEIREHFIKYNLITLKDYEIFEKKIDKISKELESRYRDKNEKFVKVKEDYQTLLRRMGIGDHVLKARYTFGEDDESYASLYEEIKEKTESRLEGLDGLIRKVRVDLLKAEHIYQPEDRETVEKVSNTIKESEEDLDVLIKALSADIIKNMDEFKTFVDKVTELFDKIYKAQTEIGRIIHSTEHQLTPEESEIMKLFERSDEFDITEIFVQVRQGGKNISIRELMTILEQLYRKNKVIIRVRRRSYP